MTQNDASIRRVYASTLKPTANTGNLGDIFGYLLMEKLGLTTMERIGIPDKDSIDGQTLILVGSILNHIRPNQNALVYGPGFITSDDNPNRLKGNRIAGVRGKLSKKKIEEAFPGTKVRVCSDPGLLMKTVMAPSFEASKVLKVGAIVHSVDRELYLKSSFNHIPIIEHYKGLERFLSDIQSYSHVISTSLHGMIFCHSLGIPVLPVAISNKITGGSFKFRDYLSSVKIRQKNDLMSLHLALRGESKLIDSIKSHPQPTAEVIERLIQRQLRMIKRLFTNPPITPSF